MANIEQLNNLRVNTILKSMRYLTKVGCNKSQKTEKLLASQSRPILCKPIVGSLPCSSVHGILQARTLEWVAVPFPRRYSQPRDQTQVSYIAGGFFTVWATMEALRRLKLSQINSKNVKIWPNLWKVSNAHLNNTRIKN